MADEWLAKAPITCRHGGRVAMDNEGVVRHLGTGSLCDVVPVPRGPLTMSDVKDIRLTTTRELLEELRERGHRWAEEDVEGSLMVLYHVDDMLAFNRPILDGTREP